MKKIGIFLLLILPAMVLGMFFDDEEELVEAGKVQIEVGESPQPFDCVGRGVVGCTRVEATPICEDQCKAILGLTRSDRVAIAFRTFTPKFNEGRLFGPRSCSFHANVVCEVTYLQPSISRAGERGHGINLNSLGGPGSISETNFGFSGGFGL